MRPQPINVAHRAFTLIEIVIAMAIMALLTATAAISFNGPINRARTVEAIEQLRYLDASSRDFARRFGRKIEIAFDLSENRIERREGASHEVAFNAAIASPLRIEAVWTAKERANDGEVVIPISSLGISQTYAIKLNGPEGQRWVMMTGLAGETATYTDDEQIQAIFSKIEAGVTLIEIVVGLVVLAVLVSSVTLARGRFMRQWSEAEKKLAATQAVDRMLAGWIGGGDSDSIPVPSQGALDGVEGCAWRTNWVADPAATRIGAAKVRLEVCDGNKRLLSVDLLKHLATRTQREVQR